MANQRNPKIHALLQALLGLGVLILLNILANARVGNRSFHAYLDMTEEKRFTLTKGTRSLLADLDDVVYVRVLLGGDFPAGFKRLQNAARELLDDFAGESGYLEYAFEDPTSGAGEEVNAFREEMARDGIIPTRLRVKEQDGASVRYIYPYALMYYKGRSFPVNLLENEVPGVPQEVILNNSIGLLEYKFANALQKLRSLRKPAIVFTAGHGELSPPETADLEKTLRQFYNTGRLVLDSVAAVDPGIDVLVVAKPVAPFSEKDKFKIDQYVMQGGKVLWLIDPLRVGLDSLRMSGDYLPLPYDLNLDDLLFRYGARIQPNMVLDLQSSRIPLATGQVGNAPQFDYFPYPYHLVVTPNSDHPVVKSLAPVNLFFPATIDTSVRVKTPLGKTVLLASSARSRLQYPPVRMNFDFLRYDLDPAKFDKGSQPLAVVLEGVFPSMYENRVTENMQAALAALGQEYRAVSEPTRMIVVSDGDVARNRVRGPEQQIVPLGYNEFENYQFANKDFLVNAIEYLLDDNGVIEARAKEVKLRLLDTTRAKAEKQKWQLINIALPLAFVVLFGFLYHTWRRKRWAA